MVDQLTALLTDPSLAFFRTALGAGSLAAVAFGVVGTYVVSQRISYLAGAIAHSVLGGIGLALYLQRVHGLGWCDPFLGAVAAALLAAVLMAAVTKTGSQRQDTVIGTIWAVGMALGLIFLARTPGYADPMSYLFGNILLVGPMDVLLVAGLDMVILLLVLLYGRRIQAVGFDPEFARLRGVDPHRTTLVLLLLTGLTVVLLVRLVGIVLVVALLTLPAALAGLWSRTLNQMMLLATAAALVLVDSGLVTAYLVDLPASAVIILLAAGAYLLALVFRR